MSHYVRERMSRFFLRWPRSLALQTLNDVSFRVLLPAYILSELKGRISDRRRPLSAIWLVDMVVASITTSVADAVAAIVISTPLKLLLLSHVDGCTFLSAHSMRVSTMGVDEVFYLGRSLLQRGCDLVAAITLCCYRRQPVVSHTAVLTFGSANQTLSLPRTAGHGASSSC